ncbi:MAG: hypothetical protein FGM46_06110 [Ferruginibacter sp.]|nr:hypothetical protein [Ferruginibacter sp.]
MEYKKLVAVTGLSGLFEMVSSKADGGIVKSLEDKSTKFVSNRLHSFSHLESIEIYTTGSNINLVELLEAIKNNKEPLPDSKADAKAIRAFFEKVYPELDFERVYGSDMKKIIKWYDLITKNNIEIKLSDTAQDKEDVSVETVAEKKTSAAKTAPTKASTVKNAPAKKINTPRKMA